MERDEILKLAEEARLNTFIDGLERFAALVAAAEREACAKVIESQDVDPSFKGRLALAIRTRGE